MTISWYSIISYNDRHVLYLRSETVAFRRRTNMVLDNHYDQVIPVEECGLNLLTFVVEEKSEKTATKKLTRPGIEPGPAG